MRAGGRALTLLGTPRVFAILRCLTEGRRDRRELRRAADSPPQSTLRGLIRNLDQAGALVTSRQDSFAGTLEYELSDAGRALLDVATSMQRWLAEAPDGPLELGGNRAKAAIKGIVEGWSATLLIRLADGPLSLTELDKQVAASYPTIERALETMRLAGQLELGPRGARGRPFSINNWLRRGLVPLAVSARWEHRHQIEGADPIHRLDLESACTVVSPILELPVELSGLCQLAVRMPSDAKPRRFLGIAEARDGTLSFREVCRDRKPDAWASATIDAWFSILIDTDSRGLRLSGNRELARGVLDSLHNSLFAREPQAAIAASAA